MAKETGKGVTLMEDKKNIVLSMEYADGTSGKRELLSIFKAENGRDYAALLQLNDDETVQENASIELVRVKQYKNEHMEDDYLIEGISSEAELKTAMKAFERLEIVDTGEQDVAVTQDTTIEELQILSFKNGKGQFEEWKVIDVFEHRSRKYIALIPITEYEDENIKINLMRLDLTVQGGIEGCEVTTISSDMEYDDVANVFEKRVDEANSVELV